MKLIMVVILVLGICLIGYSSDNKIEKYVTGFDYIARKEMKMSSKALIMLLKTEKAQLIDIRFSEEYLTWKVSPSINIPLNELPKRLSEIDQDKIVVTACPHKDRAIIAMVYLRSKGINAKYLTDGLLGLAENLRGDSAREFINGLKKSSN